jgi:hypothetical protein
MINYYLRPDQAHIRIDDENKVVTNVLISETHNFIGHNTNVDYVDSMINMASTGSLTPSNEADFNAALTEAKTFIAAI